MKQSQITKCLTCGKGVMHNNQLVFYRVEIEYLLFDTQAIRRQHGLEQMLGNHVLAHVMGPDEDLAKTVNKCAGLVCLDCAIHYPLAVIIEANNKEMEVSA